MARPKSFKTMEHEATSALLRHGYKFDQKLRSGETMDTKIYIKGIQSGCVMTIHNGETNSMTLMFHENFIQILYSAIFILTFNNYNIDVMTIDATKDKRYTCILKDLKRTLKGE